MNYEIIQNTEKQQFELHIEGKIALVTYRLYPESIAYLHTEVPKELEGRGLASALARHVLDYAETNKLKVKAYCPYIKAYIDKHPEYQKNSIFHNPDLQ